MTMSQVVVVQSNQVVGERKSGSIQRSYRHHHQLVVFFVLLATAIISIQSFLSGSSNSNITFVQAKRLRLSTSKSKKKAVVLVQQELMMTRQRALKKTKGSKKKSSMSKKIKKGSKSSSYDYYDYYDEYDENEKPVPAPVSVLTPPPSQPVLSTATTSKPISVVDTTTSVVTAATITTTNTSSSSSTSLPPTIDTNKVTAIPRTVAITTNETTTTNTTSTTSKEKDGRTINIIPIQGVIKLQLLSFKELMKHTTLIQFFDVALSTFYNEDGDYYNYNKYNVMSNINTSNISMFLDDAVVVLNTSSSNTISGGPPVFVVHNITAKVINQTLLTAIANDDNDDDDDDDDDDVDDLGRQLTTAESSSLYPLEVYVNITGYYYFSNDNDIIVNQTTTTMNNSNNNANTNNTTEALLLFSQQHFESQLAKVLLYNQDRFIRRLLLIQQTMMTSTTTNVSTTPTIIPYFFDAFTEIKIIAKDDDVNNGTTSSSLTDAVHQHPSPNPKPPQHNTTTELIQTANNNISNNYNNDNDGEGENYTTKRSLTNFNIIVIFLIALIIFQIIIIILIFVQKKKRECYNQHRKELLEGDIGTTTTMDQEATTKTSTKQQMAEIEDNIGLTVIQSSTSSVNKFGNLYNPYCTEKQQVKVCGIVKTISTDDPSGMKFMNNASFRIEDHDKQISGRTLSFASTESDVATAGPKYESVKNPYIGFPNTTSHDKRIRNEELSFNIEQSKSTFSSEEPVFIGSDYESTKTIHSIPYYNNTTIHDTIFRMEELRQTIEGRSKRTFSSTESVVVGSDYESTKTINSIPDHTKTKVHDSNFRLEELRQTIEGRSKRTFLSTESVVVGSDCESVNTDHNDHHRHPDVIVSSRATLPTILSDFPKETTPTTVATTTVRGDSTVQQGKVSCHRIVYAPPGRIGIIVETSVDGPVVQSVLPGSPVHGLVFIGDIIQQINDIDTHAMNCDELTNVLLKHAHRAKKLVVLGNNITNYSKRV